MLSIDLLPIKKAQSLYRALNHKLRLAIISLIDSKGEITVTQLYCQLRIEQSVASQHLAILRKAGFVTIRRDGKFTYYKVNYDRIETISALAEAMA